jgi:hypothetical protein
VKVRPPTKEELRIWQRLADPRTPKQRKADEEAKRKQQASCVHSMAHRNDGKISSCRICGYVRDNEP